MKVEILHVPDCPNVAVLEQRLHEACSLLGLTRPLAVTRQVVTDLDTAQGVRMTGSPTMLVDGVDPFTCPGLAPSMSCRLYVDEDGNRVDAPSVHALRHVLQGGGSPS